MFGGESPLAIATGFFYCSGGQDHLVSNWHVFSGRNTYTGQPSHKSAAVPDSFKAFFHVKGNLGQAREATVLLNHPTTGDPVWWQHPKGQDVDVAVLKLKLPPEYESYALPRPKENSDMRLAVATDAFVLGYPKGIAHQRTLPIWKRGSDSGGAGR